MKPGKNDIRVEVLITDDELTSLKLFIGDMAESFGLDRRIEQYQGKRPIGLYEWDLDCLIDVIYCVLKDLPLKSLEHDSQEYTALLQLYDRLCQIYEETWHIRVKRDYSSGH